MKFLVHGNAPHVKTGYGVQVAQLVERLQGQGHDVAVSCTYGQQGGLGTWVNPTTKQLTPLLPCGYEVNGNDIIHGHAQYHFQGDPLAGWIITCLDVWALQTPMLADFNVAAWVPVDHFPVPPDVLKFFHRTGATPVAMSRFGERLLFDAGLDPVYVPLSVDTRVYKPTPTIEVNGTRRTSRDLLGIPADAFVVGMVAMNKGWARDRKGFNEAFRAFGQFWRQHPEAILYLHAEKFGGAEGINLVELLQHCSVPEHAVRWVDQYAYRLGTPSELMAAMYSSFDVLLAPSHGEGFCVPLIEAQACGTPVIATDATAQPELVGAGWLVGGQAEWDPPQHASYVCPFVSDIVEKLETAYTADRAAMAPQAVAFAQQYDSDRVFAEHWVPFLASLEPAPPVAPKPAMDRVAVIVPAMRAENLPRLIESFDATNDGTASLYVVADVGFDALTARVGGGVCWTLREHTTFAEKVNKGYAMTDEDFVLVIGDDTELTPGYLEAARKVSELADVIGTNDSEPGRVRNPDVAAGRHADHFFVRRSYVEEQGASLDGPGSFMPTAYKHWYTDKEVVGLARARGVYVHADECRIIHHHPGYEGREDLRAADPVYMRAVEFAEQDAATYKKRLPLVEMQRVTRAKR